MRIDELEQRNSQYTVAIDLDGVLADFEGMVVSITGKTPEQLTKDEMWRSIGRYTKHVEPFFENLSVMHDAFELVRYIDATFERYFFLTATGPDRKVAEQKKKWVAKVLSPVLPVITVERSKDKAEYATPTRILIDDRSKSTIPWEEAGGIAILHKNSRKTINTLEEIINQNRNSAHENA